MIFSRVIAENPKRDIPSYLFNDYKKELITAIKDIRRVNNQIALIFKDTIFYPGGGHQPHDTGRVIISDKEFFVNRVEKRESEILHYINASIDEIEFRIGDRARLLIDWDRRYKIMKLHTAEHIFMEFIREKGYELENGQWGPSEGIITFNDEIPLNILFDCEKRTNEVIKNNVAIYRVIKEDYITIKIGDVSERPCGGNHVCSTGEIEYFKITRILKRGKTIYYNVGSEAVNLITESYNNLLSTGYMKLNLRQDIGLKSFNKAINNLIMKASQLRDINEKLTYTILEMVNYLPRRSIKIGNFEESARYLDLSHMDIQAKHLKKLGQLISDSEKHYFLVIKLKDGGIAILFKRSRKLHRALKKEISDLLRNKKYVVSSIEGGILIKSLNNIEDIVEIK